LVSAGGGGSEQHRRPLVGGSAAVGSSTGYRWYHRHGEVGQGWWRWVAPAQERPGEEQLLKERANLRPASDRFIVPTSGQLNPPPIELLIPQNRIYSTLDRAAAQYAAAEYGRRCNLQQVCRHWISLEVSFLPFSSWDLFVSMDFMCDWSRSHIMVNTIELNFFLC
jgi:hypothetical protein